MYRVLDCVATQHDLRLVALAIAICALSSYTTISLLRHVRRHIPKSGARAWLVWLVASALSTGFGIWATHFIAMLAFSPGMPAAYNVELTVLSLIVAIAITGLGLAIAIQKRWSAALGGGLLGGGIAAMHYIGMAAFEVPGRIDWDASLVRTSILLGVGFGAAALLVGLRSETPKNTALGALFLTAAICGLHFTAMGAASVTPDPTIDLSASSVPSGLLAVGVAFASFVVVGLALGGIALDLRERRRKELEAERIRGLANAAVEGLLICDGDTVVTVNDNFLILCGYSSVESILGAQLEQFFPDEDLRLKLFEIDTTLVEGVLRRRDDIEVPVELIQRVVDVAGKPHRAVAVRDLRARKEAERNILFLAHHDGLTGLPNRASFNKKLDHEIDAALQSGRRLAVLFLDLDRFKEVNDLFGHAAGDRTLQAAAARVSGALDDHQVLARLSGDEFAIILPDLSNPETAGRIAETILEVLQAPLTRAKPITRSVEALALPSFQTTRTIAAHYFRTPTPLSTAPKMRAGARIDTSKPRWAPPCANAAFSNTICVTRSLAANCAWFTSRKNASRPAASSGLRRCCAGSIQRAAKSFPSTSSRWLKIMGSIIPIGEWVLRTACHEAATWRQPLTIAVNVSAVQIHSANFAHTVHEILYETGLSPGRLELEITETALVRDLNRALATLRRIKMLGVRIAMDDFGTGYSSLSNLRAFPFDKIKIDGSFIKSVNVNEPGAAIVRSVLGLGHAMQLVVLAEGVETAAEFEFLKSENCDEVQGFLLGRPADIESYRCLTEGSDADLDATVISLSAKMATSKHI